VGRDRYTGLAVLAASLALFWATLGLERHPMVPVGPAFYPRIVLGITALMALALIVSPSPLGEGRGGGVVRPNYLLVLIAFAIFTLYVFALPYLGFRLATFIFLVAMPVALERPASVRRWIVVLVLAVVATFVTHLVFERYLHVLLPRGRWTSF
jgi:hypothetical protein